MKSRPRRSGYALVTVLVLIAVLLSFYGIAFRHTAAALRIETVRAQQSVRDRGSLEALARALALLETGLPPSDPYECAVTLDTPEGARSFTITFTSEGAEAWSVHCIPTPTGTTPLSMPVSFAP